MRTSPLAFDFLNFIGRFHPLLVHLPIGFLMLAILLEWYQVLRKKVALSEHIAFAWLLSAVVGTLAVTTGWWLSETDLYIERDLVWHRWLGIAIVALSFLGWRLKKKRNEFKPALHQGFNVLMIAMIAVEGHLGGNLTHGEDFLFEYAPEPIQRFMLDQKTEIAADSNNDSLPAYDYLVMPILETKCFACHNDNVSRGGLNMASTDSLLAGGEGGTVLVKGNADESELFRRLTLPRKNIKFMPPVGDPLTFDEIKIIEWWIGQGADFNKTLAAMDNKGLIGPSLLRRFGVSTDLKPHYETVKLGALDTVHVRLIEQNGFSVKELSADNHLLDVKFIGNDLDLNKLKSLEPAINHITWLSLAQSGITDDGLALIAKFKNLTRLRLENTNISDQGISHLVSLKHLEALNLYGTAVTDGCLHYLQELNGLKRVYLWQTKVTASKVQEIEKTTTKLKITLNQ